MKNLISNFKPKESLYELKDLKNHPQEEKIRKAIKKLRKRSKKKIRKNVKKVENF